MERKLLAGALCAFAAAAQADTSALMRPDLPDVPALWASSSSCAVGAVCMRRDSTLKVALATGSSYINVLGKADAEVAEQMLVVNTGENPVRVRGFDLRIEKLLSRFEGYSIACADPAAVLAGSLDVFDGAAWRETAVTARCGDVVNVR